MDSPENITDVEQIRTKKCRFCYAKIDSRAKICPFCRKRQKKSKVGAIIFLVVLILAACGLSLYAIALYNRHKLTERARTMPEDEFRESCSVVTYDQLMRDEDGLKGQDVSFQGEILQDAGDNLYRLAIDDPESFISSDAVLLTIPGNTSKLIEGDEILIYGTSLGMKSYEGLMGQTVTVPYIYVAYYDRIISADQQ